MKATIDVPDALYRQVKARAAMEGRSVREVSIELYERWLAVPVRSADESPGDHAHGALAADVWLSRWERLGEQIARKGVDPRTSLEILVAERR
ncbi:MAG: hypothetical protein M3406_05100 [Chloroflexota bacterium]|nr:hypothetical protein [Chloroflexota bacterium]